MNVVRRVAEGHSTRKAGCAVRGFECFFRCARFLRGGLMVNPESLFGSIGVRCRNERSRDVV